MILLISVFSNFKIERPELNLLHYNVSDDYTKIVGSSCALSNSIEDQLCMAALHYLRSHFEEATEIYKKLLNISVNIFLPLDSFSEILNYIFKCETALDFIIFFLPNSKTKVGKTSTSA